MHPLVSLCLIGLVLAVAGFTPRAEADDELFERVEHGFADNNGVKIHYVSLGEGPLVVMIHGFPDFWYSWRHQMPALAQHYRVVAMDLRGYNQSDQPEAQEAYAVPHLIGDVAAVIAACGEEKAVIVGHDWGGYIAWCFAAFQPECIKRLIVCNLPHPKGLTRELANNPEQQAASAYARAFQETDAHKIVSTPFLAAMVAGDDPQVRSRYEEAFAKSDVEAMLAYYKENYPKPPYTETAAPFPKITVPVLLFHGLADSALHHHGLNNTWEWLEAPLTLVTIPGADHWVHHDAAQHVTDMMLSWLSLHAEDAPPPAKPKPFAPTTPTE